MPIERKVPPPDELTPSELVLLFRDQFAPIQIGQADGSTTLLNRSELATRIVGAAILANEKAGAITIGETENGIVVTPAARAIPWPRGTIEGRIIGESAASVKDLVRDWLRADSLDPFERVMAIANIGATVHGYSREAEAFYASLSPAPVKTLFESCRFSTRLLDEVRAGISSRTHGFTVTHFEQHGQISIPRDNFQEPSPWELEASIDREDEPTITTISDKAEIGVAWGCVVVMVLLLIVILMKFWICFPIPLLGIGVAIYYILKVNAEQRIQERVIEIEHAQQTSTPQQPPVTIVASEAVPAPPLTIIDPDTLPEVSTDVSFPLPPRLLMLRVFGSPAIENLLELTKPWEEFGVITHLAGPGTVGENIRDVLKVAIGRVDDAITENDQELDEAFARIGARKKGRDSLQCTDATWKRAIDRMLADASAVLMDLSSMSRAHQGCAYELGLLLDRLPLGRVTLLVNDDSDIDFLREILERAWLQIDERSPNRNESGLTWRAIRIGGLAARRTDENVYEWERRLRHRLRPIQLVGFLMSSAMSRSV